MSGPVPFHFSTLAVQAPPVETAREIPHAPGVFRIFDVHRNLILLDRTSNLAERIGRHFADADPVRPAEAPGALDLREIASRIEYCRTSSPLETVYLLYLERRRWFPATYGRMATFPKFHLLKINRRQRFPRLYAARALKPGVGYYGPFKSRSEMERLKAALERAFRIRPCEYNIRGNDPHPDCMYFQMHTCSRPCNNDVGRTAYLDDVEGAIAFIEGRDGAWMDGLLDRVRDLAEQTRFEEAEQTRRRLERIRKAREDHPARYFDLWRFDYVAVMPSTTAKARKIAVVQGGAITTFEEHSLDTFGETIRRTLHHARSSERSDQALDRRYDEFCIVSNFLLHPVQSVQMVPFTAVDETADAVEAAARRKTK